MPTKLTNPIIEPNYVQRFQCLGDRCPSNCCHSWTIPLDKKNFKEARKSSDSVIKVLAKEHFKRLTDSSNSSTAYGYIQLNRQGLCPMLDEGGWCEVHKRLGERALSITCQQYPRVPQYFGNRIEMSLMLSCPGVADEVLFNPEAMILHQVETSSALKPNYSKSGILAKSLPVWADMLRDFSFQILLCQQLTLPERLFVIGLTYHQIDSHLENPIKVESILKQNVQLIKDDSFRNAFSSLPKLSGHKWNIFSHQLSGILASIQKDKEAKSGLSPSEARYMALQMPMVRLMGKIMSGNSASASIDCDAWIMTDESKSSAASDAFEHLLDQAKPIMARFFGKHPQLLLNFLLYQVYHHQFLLPLNRSPIQFFQVMMVDVLVLEAYMAGIAVETGELDRETIVALFSAYAKKRQHSKAFIDGIEKCLEESASDKLAAVFALLK